MHVVDHKVHFLTSVMLFSVVPNKDVPCVTVTSVEDLNLPNDVEDSSDTVVIQAVRKGPEGREVSVFKVTKSAPNTPKMKRLKIPNRQTALSTNSSDEESNNQPSSCTQLQNAFLKSLPDDSTIKKSARSPQIIIHKPSLNAKSDNLQVFPKFNASLDARRYHQKSSEKTSSSKSDSESPPISTKTWDASPSTSKHHRKQLQFDPILTYPSGILDSAPYSNDPKSNSPSIPVSLSIFPPDVVRSLSAPSTQTNPTLSGGTLPRAFKSRRRLQDSNKNAAADTSATLTIPKQKFYKR